MTEGKGSTKLVVLEEKAKVVWGNLTDEKMKGKFAWISLGYDEKDIFNLNFISGGKIGIEEAKKTLNEKTSCLIVSRGYHRVKEGGSFIPINMIYQYLPSQHTLFDRSRLLYHTEHIIELLSLSNFFVFEVHDPTEIDLEKTERQIRKLTNQQDGEFLLGPKQPSSEEEEKKEGEEKKEEVSPKPEESAEQPQQQQEPAKEEASPPQQQPNAEEMKKTLTEIAQKYKLKDLMKDPRRHLKKFCDCEIGMSAAKKKCQFYLLNDMILITGIQKNKITQLQLGIPDFRCYEDEQDKTVFIIETNPTPQKKKKKGSTTLQMFVIGMAQGEARDQWLEDTVRAMIDAKCRYYCMDGAEAVFRKQVIFQSYLEKEGGGKFSYSVKKRWHVLTGDHQISYLETPEGKKKGSYAFAPGTTFGRGKDVKKANIDVSKNKSSGLFRLVKNVKSVDVKAVSGLEKKECWFYIDSPSRIYFNMAQDVVVLDNWMKVLRMMGGQQKDVLDWAMEQWQQDELEKLKDRVSDLLGGGLKGIGEEDDFDLPDMFGAGGPGAGGFDDDNDDEEELEGEGEEMKKVEQQEEGNTVQSLQSEVVSNDGEVQKEENVAVVDQPQQEVKKVEGV